MKILAFAASNSRSSINKSLVTYAANLVEGADIEILDLNDYEMPIYSSDRENESGIHPLAQSFFAKITEADAIMISFAEHNGSYTAAYKNIFDWMSRIDMKVYQGKPTLLLAASPGPGGANTVLSAAKTSAPYFGMDVKADLSVASFYDVFDTEKAEAKDITLEDKLMTAVSFLNSTSK